MLRTEGYQIGSDPRGRWNPESDSEGVTRVSGILKN